MSGHQAEPRGRRRGRLLALALGASSSFVAADARADWDFQLAANLNGGWLRETPALSAPSVLTSAREMAGGTAQPRGGLALAGFGGDIDLTIDDRWKVLLLGGSFSWAVGSYDATITGLDGSIARLRPWSAVRGDFLLPGLGRRWKYRRTMWAAAVRTGFSHITMDGAVAAGADAVELELSATTFLVQVDLETCRRLDPTTRVCLQVSPRVYEHELMNGLTFGLRMEWGR